MPKKPSPTRAPKQAKTTPKKAKAPRKLPSAKLPADPPRPQTKGSTQRRQKHTAWTRKKMADFLRELAASQSVSQAARSVGMSRQSAYRLRNRVKETPFDLGWEVALEMGYGQLAQALMDRAVNGEEIPHYYKGELVGTHRRYDNGLGRWVLNNPWKLGRYQVAREYSAPGFDSLLERIELAEVDWRAGEPLPALGDDPLALNAHEEGADGEGELAEDFGGELAGDLAAVPEHIKREDQFTQRSWYVAEAASTQKGR